MNGSQPTASYIGEITIGRRNLVGRRKKFKPCDLCGGVMEKGGAGYVCSNCHNIEWYTEESTSMSSVVKCPHCGSISPNIYHCVVCGMEIKS